MTDALADKAVNPKAVLTGSAPLADETEGMSYLQSLPRRLVTLYLPLSIILSILLFPVLLDGTNVSEARRAAARSRHL